MLVQIRPPGPPRGGDHRGMVQQTPFHPCSDPVRLGKRGPRQADRRDGQRTFPERGQELAAQRGNQGQRAQQQHARPRHHDTRAAQGPFQQGSVEALHAAQQPGFLLLRQRAILRQEQGTEHRGHGDRHQQGGQNGHDVGLAERAQHAALHPGQEEERHEHDGNDEGRVDDRIAHFARGIADQRERRLPHVLRLLPVAPQPPVGVLHEDDGVVDQGADGDRHPPQGHRVDRAPEQQQGDDGQRERQGNRQNGNDRRAQVPEEEEQDDDDEHRPVAERLDHVLDGKRNEIRLAEDGPRERDAFGKLGLDGVQLGVHALRELQRVGARLFLNREDDGRLGIHCGRPEADLRADAHVGDILDQHGHAVAHRNHGEADLLQAARASEAPDEDLPASGSVDSARHVAVRCGGGGEDLVQRDPVRPHPAGIDQDLVLAHLAPDGDHLRHARHGQQPAPHRPVRGGAGFHELRFRRGHADQQDLAHDRTDRGEDGSRHVVGELRHGEL